MNALCGIVLVISSVLVAAIVNEVLSPDYHSSQYWLRTDVDNEVKHCLSSGIVQEGRQSCRLYAIVIDGGSTGTRLHLFEFKYDFDGGAAPFRVEKETFKEVKPGLSGFASDPERAAESVNELLVTAKSVIPEAHWKHTPITLKATAGLRLLPSEQANDILNYVEERVRSSGFLVGVDGVGILSGTDEGIFSWVTLNVLIDRLKNVVQQTDNNDAKSRRDTDKLDNPTAAALDLGGGSTQITFLPFNPEEVFTDQDQRDFSHNLNVFGNQIDLYTHSYLGNGLVAARLGITKGSTNSSGTSLTSNCLPAGFTIKNWDYAGKWNVMGSPEASFKSCVESAVDYVGDTGVREVPELKDHDLYAFSYFYERGLQAGLIPSTDNRRGGTTTVGDFKEAAVRACSRSADEFGAEHWQPWQCLDLSYIYALLRHGYGLDDNKHIFLAKHLRSMEVSWALGSAYDLLGRYLEKVVTSGILSTNTSSPSANPANSSFVDGLIGFFSEQTIVVFTYLGIIS